MVAGLGLGTNGNAQTLSAPEIPDIEAPAYKYCRTIDHDGMGKTVCFPPDGPNRSGLPYNVIPNYTSFGMNDLRTEHIADETYPLSQADLDRIEQLGTRVLRVPFFSDRDNAWLDGIVREAAERGITILPILANRGWYPPTTEGERASFRTFVSRVSTRYGILDDGRPGWFWQGNTSVAPHPIVAWEIWNEPNLYEFWKAPPGGAQTAEYGRLLLDAASELRLSRYNRLVLGGLSDQPYFDRSLGIQPHQFVKEALDYASATGGRHRACYIDAVGLHPYGQTDLASPQRSADSAFSSLAAMYFSLNHPDIINLPRTPIWITEFGWQNGDGDVDRSGFQAAAYDSFLLRVTAVRISANIGPIMPFAFRDSDTPNDYPTEGDEGSTDPNVIRAREADTHLGLRRTLGTLRRGDDADPGAVARDDGPHEAFGVVERYARFPANREALGFDKSVFCGS